MASTHPDADTDVTAPDRRQEIITAVRHAMNQFGVRRLTVADVALQAGVSRQTVYEYFPSRGSLVDAALEAAGWELISAAESRVPESAPPVEQLAALIEVVLAYFAASPLWSAEAKRAEFIPHLMSPDSTFVMAATAALRERMIRWWPEADPVLRPRAADTLVRVLISHGLAPEEVAPDALARQLATLVTTRL